MTQPTNSKTNELDKKLDELVHMHEDRSDGWCCLRDDSVRTHLSTLLQQTAQEARLDELAYALHFTAHMSRKDAHQAILDQIAALKAKQEEE